MTRRLSAVLAAVVCFVPIVLTEGPLGAQTDTCLMLGWTGFEPGSGVPPLFRGTLQNVDGTEIRALDGVTGFGWSPGGESLGWSEQEFAEGTLRIGDATASTVDATLPGAGGRHVVWSPAGGRMLVADELGVRIVEATGAVIEVWPEGRQASWSSDGAWITWTSDAGVLVARADGSDVHVAAGMPSNGSIWRPGTHQLLVLAPSMLIYDADTGVLTPFSVSPIQFAEGFAWSPDGSALAWSASVDGVQPPRIFVERFDGNPAGPISPAIPQTGDPSASRPFESPAWSPDGSTIVAAEFDAPWSIGITFGRPSLRLLPTSTPGGGVSLGPIGPEIPPALMARVHSTRWSPDSRWLLVQVEGVFAVGPVLSAYGGYVVPVDGSAPPRSVGASQRGAGEMSWWPVIGVAGEGGACVPPDAAPPPTRPAPQPATRPQFTG